MPSTVVTSAPPTSDAAAAVLNALSRLPVKGRAPKSGYDRALFGDPWTDDVSVAGGRNGCDTRNDILRRDPENVVLKVGSNDCAVVSGTLHDPYSNSFIEFERGPRRQPMFRSTTSWLCLTVGRRAPRVGMSARVATSRTTLVICRPPSVISISRSGTVTRQPGSHRMSPIAALMSHALST